MAVTLMSHQQKALDELEDGKVLWGGVGSGKSHVALAYYVANHSGSDVVVLTTAKKRDSLEWQEVAAQFGIGRTRDATLYGTITVDSWNNIGKYIDHHDTFFIFDEQRVVGSGAWVKAFLQITRDNKNGWILLSATPGDTWLDYVPIFLANGYYRNPTHFKHEHVIYKPFRRFPQIDRFVGEDRLLELKNEVLVEMPYKSEATRHHVDIKVEYDHELFKKAFDERWNVYKDEPIRDVAEMFAVVRKIVYTDPSRIAALRKLLEKHEKIIVFYNFNYELEMLRELNDTWSDLVTVAEWNGQRKQPIPDTDNWVYLVQYQAGAEGWNCTETDCMVFYSLNYSYKLWEQAQGRIDRLNTYFSDLWYYTFFTDSWVDKAVRRSLTSKEAFNEARFFEAQGWQMSTF